ncbi:MAG: cupin domain-containing protein [Gordonia sp. (in: high G+C Gram-positive bacteria)]|uniref:cupin domain-containing protein n=1 Tax=Gordonia sp. (in: high G+C Gram-positive bacteria) TaxID=84139 RepID=UPI0039E47291
MDTAAHGGQEDFEPRHAEQGAFVYTKHVVTPKHGSQLHVSFMEIPPGKSAFPYHYHDGITEAFVILQGTARVRTSTGDIALGPGEVIVFPPGPPGAHRITNVSPDEPLRYVDLDTTSIPDVIHYPDSGKTAYNVAGVPGAAWRDADQVDYYDGESDAGMS